MAKASSPSSDDYLGVIVRNGSWRLIISATGSRYILQENAGSSGGWVRRHWSNHFRGIMIDAFELFPTFDFDGVPSNPADYVR